MSVILLSKMYNLPNHEKRSDKLKLKDFLQNTWPVLFKSFKAERPRNCHKLKETRKDLTPHPPWYPILNPAWHGGKDDSAKMGN